MQILQHKLKLRQTIVAIVVRAHVLIVTENIMVLFSFKPSHFIDVKGPLKHDCSIQNIKL